MQVRYYAGPIHSTDISAAVIYKGRMVKRNSSGQWIHCVNDEVPMGVSLMDHRVISSGFNIFNASYDEGLTGTYNGRRNPYKQSYDNVGQPLGVLMGKGNIIEEIPYTAYVGNLAHNATLSCNASGQFKAFGSGAKVAMVVRAANRANRELLGVMTL